MNDVETVGHYDEADTRLARERSYHAFNLASIVNGICARLDSKRSRRGLQRSLVIADDKRGRLRIEQKCEPRNARRHFLEHFHPFAHHRRFVSGEPGNVSTRMGQVGDEAGADWIGNLNEHDWNGAGFFLEGGDCWGHVTNNYVRLQCDQRLRESLDPGGIAGGPAMIKSKVAALHPSQFLQRLMERLHHRRRFQVAFANGRQPAEAPPALALLRARRKRPRRSAAEKRDELAPLQLRDHSITSSARSRMDVGNAIPKLFAVLRLITSANFVGNSAGSSAGLAPRSTLATKAAP